MQRLMKGCVRGALGLGAAALLLAGVPAQAGSSAGSPGQVEPRLMAQSTAQTEEAEKLEKLRLEEQRKKLEQQQQQEQQQQKTQEKQIRTRGAMPEAAPAPEATPKPGGKRFGAGVVRHGDPGDTEEKE